MTVILVEYHADRLVDMIKTALQQMSMKHTHLYLDEYPSVVHMDGLQCHLRGSVSECGLAGRAPDSNSR